jgi:hypothetical protein
MLNKIEEVMKQTSFASIIKAEVVDECGKFQLSSVLHYVTPDDSAQEWFI